MVTDALVIIKIVTVAYTKKTMKCFYQSASMSEFSEIVLIKSEKSVI